MSFSQSFQSVERRNLVQRVIDETSDNNNDSSKSEPQNAEKEFKRKHSSTDSNTMPQKTRSTMKSKSPASSDDSQKEFSTPKFKPRPISDNWRGECSWLKIKPRPTNKDNINIKRATPSSFRTGYQDKNEWEDIETEELKTLGEDEMVNYHIEYNF